MEEYYDGGVFDRLVGKKLIAIEGLEVGSEVVTFRCDDGKAMTLVHHSACCESVQVQDVAGNPNDLIGEPVLFAEESSNGDDAPPASDYPPESYTWTFYRIGTIKGAVVIRWFGESNGYYSESVSIHTDI